MIEEEAARRLAICEDCGLFDTKGDSCIVPGTAPCCSACGCCLAFKIRSLASECAHPNGAKWKAVISEEEQDRIYDSIKYDPYSPTKTPIENGGNI